MGERTYTVEVYEQEGKTKVFISAPSSSGCHYVVESADDVGRCLADYIDSFDTSYKSVV